MKGYEANAHIKNIYKMGSSEIDIMFMKCESL